MGEHLTQEQHAQLAAELAELEGPRRKKVVEAIAVARGDGDLSENFEYHAAKNEQGLLERKITILRARLEDAEIVESGDGDVVAVGSTVVIEDGDGGQMEVEISGLGGSGKTLTLLPARHGAARQARRRDRRGPGAEEHLAGDRRLDRLDPLELVERPLVANVARVQRRLRLDQDDVRRPPRRPAGARRLCGTTISSPGSRMTSPSRSSIRIRPDDDQEELVLVVVVVPDELAFELDDLDVGVVQLGDDLRAPVLVELPELRPPG